MTSTEKKTLTHYLARYRVHLGHIIFYAIIYYCFFYAKIEVQPFLSPLYIAGIVVIAMGLLVRSLSAGAIKKNQELSTTGIYAIARHPLYLGSLLIVIGLNLVVFNIAFLIGTAILYTLPHYSAITREEAFLTQAFPEQWAEFVRTTPAVLPRLSQLGKIFSTPWDFKQWRKNGEYNASIAVIILLTLLYFYSKH